MGEQPAAATRMAEISTLFPAGQGDFLVTSADRMLFYVHQTALLHASGNFKAAFEKSASEATAGAIPALKMEENAVTLEILFQYVYQDRQSPSIGDVHILNNVFRAARKYEMEGVLQQLRKSLLETRLHQGRIIQPLYVRYPFATLAIATAFDCKDEARFALRECLKGDLASHIKDASGIQIPADLVVYVMRLRRERAAWFSSKLDSWPWPTEGCHNCYRGYAEIRMQLEKELAFSLDYKSVKQVVIDPSRTCSSQHHIPEATRELIQAWDAEWFEMKQPLPLLYTQL
ncbi:SubName: Full=Uncharacterized protein {ECO:0000313/EMBL:CCA72179.1} [Serendipita indica DSM 11827]|nr:SubName: Full=Uncharacterized protein {ECO:0000313/EMBL:CCA72179.1} [Serendipita indica DSM 11827]